MDGQFRGAQGDPLGRPTGQTSDSGAAQGGRVAKGELAGRARDILDEVQRRLRESQRPEPEQDYLRRLLDRF